MKNLLLFFIFISSLHAKLIFNPVIYKNVEEVIDSQIVELNNHLDKNILKEINIVIEDNNNENPEIKTFLSKIQNSITQNPKVHIINASDIASRNLKNTYTLKLKFIDTKYKFNLGFKHEFSGISALELILDDTNSLSFKTYMPLNFSWKLSDFWSLTISLLIISLGIAISFFTKNKYIREISGITIFLFLVFNIYFYVIL